MTEPACRRWNWARMGAVGIHLAVAMFISASLTAKWTFAQDQDVQPGKKQDAGAKQKAKNPAPAAGNLVPGTGTKVDAKGLAKIIDQEINQQLAGEKLPVSPRSSDTEFLRRVYLDLVGVIPPAEKVTAFLESKDADKRAKVIDELLADPRFGTHIAEIWSERMVPKEANNRRQNQLPLQNWLAQGFNNDKPLNKMVYELLTSIGESDNNGAVAYFIANPTVDKMTDNVTRMFLGVQLQCAQCHNHPFTDYKQNEFWGMAAFFMKVRLTANPAKAAKKGTAVGVFETGTAPKAKKGKGALPEGARIVPAKFLQGAQPKLNADAPARPVLAGWITSGKNPFFAKAMVNRFWYQLFGRGLVNPVDDMHDDNGPTHPELLAALAEQLTRNNFDTKFLLRAICNSETYQRTSRPLAGNKDDGASYSHRLVRVLTPEQLYDSIVMAAGKVDRVAPQPAKKGVALTGRDAFTNFFRVDDGANPLEYQSGIPQALRLMNAPQFNRNSEAVQLAMQAGKTPAEIIDKLFLRTLSRHPTAQELQRFTAHVANSADPRIGYGDMLWALVNSSEFTFNH